MGKNVDMLIDDIVAVRLKGASPVAIRTAEAILADTEAEFDSLRRLPLGLVFHKEDQEEGSRKMAKSHSAYQQARQAFHTKAFAGLQQGKQFGSPSGSLDYQVGDRVRHVKFGDGTVISIVEGGRDYEVTVDFDGPGTKKMFAAFARLQKI